MTALMRLINQAYAGPLTPEMLNSEMNLASQALPFFPTRMLKILEEGPLFVLTYGAFQAQGEPNYAPHT